MADDVEARGLFVVGVDHVPGRLPGVGAGEHLVFGARVLGPVFARFQIHGAQLPALQGILHALLEAALLLLVADGEPVLEQKYSGADQHALELRATAHELQIFGFGAKAHHALHPGAVVPTAVEEHHFARGGQVRRVALEVPLGLFALGGRAEGDHAANAGVQGFGDALDGAALAGSVAALKERDDAQPLMLDPLLQLGELDLETAELFLVLAVFADLERGLGSAVGVFLFVMLITVSHKASAGRGAEAVRAREICLSAEVGELLRGRVQYVRLLLRSGWQLSGQVNKWASEQVNVCVGREVHATAGQEAGGTFSLCPDESCGFPPFRKKRGRMGHPAYAPTRPSFRCVALL